MFPTLTSNFLFLIKENVEENGKIIDRPSKKKLSDASNKLKYALRLEEERKNNHYVESLTNSKHTNYSLWKATKTIKPPVETEKPIRNCNGSWARNPEEKAIVFANHLKTVFQPNPAKNDFVLPRLSEVEYSQEHIQINLSELKMVIKDNMKIKKSPGYDLVSPAMIKNLPNVPLIVLTNIFNAIIEQGYFPVCWKISQIILIPKPGKDLSVPSSYRPISLLPCLSKLFEKLFQLKIKSFLVTNNVIPDHQFGF